MVKQKEKFECPYTEEVKTLRRGLIWSLLLIIVMSFYTALLSMDYRIELELGNSLSPIIGRYAVLLVQENPPEVSIGDMVTVVCAGDMGVITMRKVIIDFSCHVVDVNNELVADYIRLASPTTDYGWFPVSSVRAKVVKVLFRGFINPPNKHIIYPPEKIAPKWVK